MGIPSHGAVGAGGRIEDADFCRLLHAISKYEKAHNADPG
jgi:hypothetical protein